MNVEQGWASAMSKHANIHIFTILRRAKTLFHNKLCQFSKIQDPIFLQKLRSENVFVVAEFFFLLKEFAVIEESDKLSAYIRNHNMELQRLMDTPEECHLLGLGVQRLQRGMFSDLQIEKACGNLALPDGGLDQADIQKLMILLFSAETTRRLLENLEQAGLLERVTTPYQSKIVHSHGHLETFFVEYLEEVKRELI